MMTRAERRRMERESGSRTTYQFTLEQIEAMKGQAVLDAKEKMKEEIAKEIAGAHPRRMETARTGYVRRE